jgi:hypothetical protein
MTTSFMAALSNSSKCYSFRSSEIGSVLLKKKRNGLIELSCCVLLNAHTRKFITPNNSSQTSPELFAKKKLTGTGANGQKKMAGDQWSS